jgi:hypothetical protein
MNKMDNRDQRRPGSSTTCSPSTEGDGEEGDEDKTLYGPSTESCTRRKKPDWT